ncbi:U-box domain-containing protein 17-like [Wolffia australiana]
MGSSREVALMAGRKLPQAGSLIPPVGLADLALVGALANTTEELAAAAAAPLKFHRANARFLFRAAKILSAVLEFLCQSSSPRNSPSPGLPRAANACFRELYVLFHRARIVLDYCGGPSRLWLFVNNSRVAAHFHDVAQEMATLMDVLPARELALDDDLLEQIELLRRQSHRPPPSLDPRDDALRRRVSAFLDGFCNGQPPDPATLHRVFVAELGIRDAASCRAEIDFLEERIHAQEDDLDDPALAHAVVALARYARFALFGLTGGRPVAAAADSPAEPAPPKELCCPISLDLMRDPVVVATGQTYDRAAIAQWLDEGHRTCPTSGQPLAHTRLVPNRALRNLIAQWCAASGVPYDSPALGAASLPIPPAAAAANRATARLLVQQLARGSAVAESARELRLLARAGQENRRCVAEEGAVPALRRVLRSPDPAAQAHAVTAILNLSLLDSNRGLIMREPGCLHSIVLVSTRGLTVEARENAAAVLFSLSAVHGYKPPIAAEPGALESLAALLRGGTSGGKKDAVAALFNLAAHPQTSDRMVESGVAAALVAALGTEVVAEEAAAALALLARQPAGTAALSADPRALSGLLGLMRRGSPRGKENAVAALLEICRTGGAAAAQRVARAPALGSLVQTILFTGTKRARRKAASLVRLCRRTAAASPLTGGWPMPLGGAAEFSSVLDSSAAVPAT